MTFFATAGAPLENVPAVPSLPCETTTTTPASTRRSATTAVGYVGHVSKDAPRLMLMTSMPSAWARSMACRITSVSLLAFSPQPKTR